MQEQVFKWAYVTQHLGGLVHDFRKLSEQVHSSLALFWDLLSSCKEMNSMSNIKFSAASQGWDTFILITSSVSSWWHGFFFHKGAMDGLTGSYLHFFLSKYKQVFLVWSAIEILLTTDETK